MRSFKVVLGLGIFVFLQFSCKTSGGGNEERNALVRTSSVEVFSFVKKKSNDASSQLPFSLDHELLILYLDYLPELSSSGEAAEATCLPVFQDEFVLGEAVCTTPKASEIVPIKASHMEQTCNTNPEFIKTQAAKEEIKLEGCKVAKVSFYTFEPNLQFNIRSKK